MAITKKIPTRVFLAFDIGKDSLFYRAWQLMTLDGPLCPLPNPKLNAVSAGMERLRRQQVHVDEIKRLCHVPVVE